MSRKNVITFEVFFINFYEISHDDRKDIIKTHMHFWAKNVGLVLTNIISSLKTTGLLQKQE